MRLNKLNEAPLFTGSSFDVPAKLQDLIVAGRYDDAYKYASSVNYSRENPGQTQERGQTSVIDAYLNAEHFPVGDKGGGAVVRFIIKSLGMGKDNPFLDYIANYSKAHKLSKAFWIALNNAYAEPVKGQYMIDAVDLQNSERGKVSLLLYNDGLFDNNEPEHLTDILWSFRNFEALYKKSGKTLPTPTDSSENDAVAQFQADINRVSAIHKAFQASDHDLSALTKADRRWLRDWDLIDAQGNVTTRYGEGRDLLGVLTDFGKEQRKRLQDVLNQTPETPEEKPKQKKKNLDRGQLKKIRDQVFFDEQGLVRPWEQIKAELPR